MKGSFEAAAVLVVEEEEDVLEVAVVSIVLGRIFWLLCPVF